MIIDLHKKVLRKTLANFITLVVLALVIVTLLFLPTDNWFKGIDNTLLAIFCAISYVIYSLFNAFRNFHYIYFNDESDKIVLRFFSPGYFTWKKNSIEIPKKEFAGYNLKSFYMRYRESIVLMRHTGKGIGKYPPVSLTLLDDQERLMMLRSLDHLKSKRS
jgi:hypothetical protein